MSSAKRFSRLPEIPPFAEAALPGFESDASLGVVAPVGTAPEVIGTLNAAFVSVLKDQEIIERIRALGAEPMPMAPAEFAAFITSDIDKWLKVVTVSGTKPN